MLELLFLLLLLLVGCDAFDVRVVVPVVEITVAVVVALVAVR